MHNTFTYKLTVIVLVLLLHVLLFLGHFSNDELEVQLLIINKYYQKML